jgi:hypothetical protein
MPLVLTQNEATESGHEYADVFGVSYEYPSRYRNAIRPGQPFVYYRGRRRATGGHQPQSYLGLGIVGQIAAGATEGRFTCRIEDFRRFDQPLPFKEGGNYLEPGAAEYGTRAGLYFRQGVRVIDDETFRRIVAAGGPAHAPEIPPTSGYASPTTAQLVDDIAMELALAEASMRFPTAQIKRMPHSNPGFDIRVVTDEGAVRYLEVKGTTRPSPRFFMSEGEWCFSVEHAPRYSLWVFYGIDLQARTGSLRDVDGTVGSPHTTLEPIQYAGAVAM